MIGRRLIWGIGLVAVALAVLAWSSVAAAAPRGIAPDPSFGNHGRTIERLPDAYAQGSFGPIAAAADGKYLVAYEGRGRPWSVAVERRLADGALDPSFGTDGSVEVKEGITALAEDPSGGVIIGWRSRLQRLEPDGTPDKAFDRRVGFLGGGDFVPATIAFDAAGGILVGGSYAEDARYYPGEGTRHVLRYQPDGSLDRSFGDKGSADLGGEFGADGQVEILPDGSILGAGQELVHLSAGGTALPFPKIPLEYGTNSLVAFPDGGFATAHSPEVRITPGEEDPGCTVTRYRTDGSVEAAFAKGGVWRDETLAECELAATPEGGLLVDGIDEPAGEEATPRLIRIDAIGAPVASFGEGGLLDLSVPDSLAAGEPLRIGSVAVTGNGRIVAAGGARDAILLGLEADGAPTPAFGDSGIVDKSRRTPSGTSARAIAVEADGELIVTGTTDSGRTGAAPFWMRFGAEGRLIRTADGAAFRTVPRSGAELLPAGGKYVYSLNFRWRQPAEVSKYTRGGTSVRGFGEGGVVHLPEYFDASTAVADADGGVTIVGAVRGGERMAVYRLTAAGRPDPRFGRRGLAVVQFGKAESGRALSGLALPGGGVLMVGRAGRHLGMAEVGADGRPVRSFGGGGRLTCGCAGGAPLKARVVAHRGAFYIVVSSRRPKGSGLRSKWSSSRLIRVTATGTFDRSFGDRGEVTTETGAPLAVYARGKRLIVVARAWRWKRGRQTLIREFSLGGVLDASHGGRVTVVGQGGTENARLSVGLQPHGRLVLAGKRLGKDRGGLLELLALR